MLDILTNNPFSGCKEQVFSYSKPFLTDFLNVAMNSSIVEKKDGFNKLYHVDRVTYYRAHQCCQNGNKSEEFL